MEDLPYAHRTLAECPFLGRHRRLNEITKAEMGNKFRIERILLRVVWLFTRALYTPLLAGWWCFGGGRSEG